MKKLIMSFMLAFTLLFSSQVMAGCSGNKTEILNTIDEFEYACSNLDIKAMLKTIDPEIGDPIRLILAVVGHLNEEEYSDLIDSLFSGITDISDNSVKATDILKTIEITDEKVSGSKVECKINFTIAGETFTQKAKIKLKEIEDKWYIMSISGVK